MNVQEMVIANWHALSEAVISAHRTLFRNHHPKECHANNEGRAERRRSTGLLGSDLMLSPAWSWVSGLLTPLLC
jgi:hypothetical protein